MTLPIYGCRTLKNVDGLTNDVFPKTTTPQEWKEHAPNQSFHQPLAGHQPNPYPSALAYTTNPTKGSEKFEIKWEFKGFKQTPIKTNHFGRGKNLVQVWRSLARPLEKNQRYDESNHFTNDVKFRSPWFTPPNLIDLWRGFARPHHFHSRFFTILVWLIYHDLSSQKFLAGCREMWRGFWKTHHPPNQISMANFFWLPIILSKHQPFFLAEWCLVWILSYVFLTLVQLRRPFMNNFSCWSMTACGNDASIFFFMKAHRHVASCNWICCSSLRWQSFCRVKPPCTVETSWRSTLKIEKHVIISGIIYHGFSRKNITGPFSLSLSPWRPASWSPVWECVGPQLHRKKKGGKTNYTEKHVAFWNAQSSVTRWK